VAWPRAVGEMGLDPGVRERSTPTPGSTHFLFGFSRERLHGFLCLKCQNVCENMDYKTRDIAEIKSNSTEYKIHRSARSSSDIFSS
jgi:hypothetical protein